MIKEKAKSFLVPDFVGLDPGTVVFDGISGEWFKKTGNFHHDSVCMAIYYI